MIIKAVCKKHPEAPVLLLEETISFDNIDLESATKVYLDEANLYCTEDDDFNHDVQFEVVQEETDGHR